MAKTKAARKHGILSTPTRPLEIDRRKNVAALLDKMQGVSFQGRNLGVAYQIKNRLIDCLTSTGANFFHDIHESLGRFHFQCSPQIDDVELQKNLIDRMFDTLADEEAFR